MQIILQGEKMIEKKIILSEREKQIIHLIKNVPSLKVMAVMLGISYRTLQWHLSRLYAKFHVRNRLELIIEITGPLDENFIL